MSGHGGENQRSIASVIIHIRNTGLVLTTLLLLGCSTPAQHFSAHANTLGFAEKQVTSDQFQHVVFFNQLSGNQVLHVYLDGDGTPWEKRRWVASDPTSRNPMILDLMAADQKPSALIGRPCYHRRQLLNDDNCRPELWTSHRYSKEVVASMVEVLQKWLANNPYPNLVFVGYSGGGTLAMLIAPYFKQTRLIITIAANLDVAEWNAHHGYAPFEHSLDPANKTASFRTIPQVHLAGAKDKVVPLGLIKKFAQKNEHATFKEFPEADHRCCWLEYWESVLTELGI
jgi:pimeloyl-ACP methyl ester carboxylesterase